MGMSLLYANMHNYNTFFLGQQAFPRKMEAGRSVVHEDKIYFAAFESSQICYYSVDSERWTDLGTPIEYINPGLAIIRGCVAAIGGHKSNNPTNEVYVWKDQNWVKLEKSMKHRRSDPAVATSANEKIIIVVSGKNHTSVANPWVSCVEIYDVNKDEWEEVCPLPSPYSRIEMTLCKGMVYVFPDQYPTAFKCCLNTLVDSAKGKKENIWKESAGFPLRFSTPVTFDDNIMCFGGAGVKKDGRTSIHMYNEQEKSWQKVGDVEGEGRMYSMVEVCNEKCVVVGGLHELTDERDPAKRLKTVSIFTRESLAPPKR